MAWQLLQHYLFCKRASSFIKTMSWLCILGIAIGVASLIIVVSIMNGFNNSMRDSLLKAEPHLSLWLSPKTNCPPILASSQTPSTQTYEQCSLEKLLKEIKKRSHPWIENITPFEQQDVIVRTLGGELSGAIAKGIKPMALGQLLQQMEHKTWSPHLLSFAKDWPPGELLMGDILAQNLNLYGGDPITLLPPDLLILPKGEIPPMKAMVLGGVLSTGMESFDRQMILYNKDYPISPFIKASSLERGFDIWLKDPDQANKVKNQLHGLGRIQTWEEKNKARLLAIKIEKLAISTLLSLGTLITSFSIVTVLVLLLTQKRADIGLLMVLGLSRQKTQLVFMKIGMFLSLMGLGSGAILGLLVSAFLALTSFEVLPSDIYYEPSIPAQITANSLFLIFSGSLIISFLASWLPVRFYIDKNLSANWRRSL